MEENVAIQINHWQEDISEAWDRFVVAHPQGTLFHLSAWKRALEQAYGHALHYLYAQRAGEIVGVMPLGHVKSLLFGNALISTPFAVYGGAIANDDATLSALEQEACRIADSLQVDAMELRLREQRYADWPTKGLYVTFRKEISSDHDANMQAIPRKQRAMVRKALKNELVAEIDDNVDRLYDVYSHSVWRLGTPVFPKRFFVALKKEFGDACEVMTITKDGKPVASVMNFYFRDEVLPYYGGGTDDARNLMANDFMYWQVMCRAADQGVRVFDYGRSKEGTGSYSFKKHWGFEPAPLPYQYYLVKAKQMPEINPMNPKFRLFVNGWKKMPLPLTRIVGPWLAKDLG